MLTQDANSTVHYYYVKGLEKAVKTTYFIIQLITL